MKACQSKNRAFGGIRLRGVGLAQPTAVLRHRRMWRSRTELGRSLDPDGLGEQVGEEISGTDWRGPGRTSVGDLGREPQVSEDLADDPWVLNGRDQAHAAAAARVGQDIHVEGAAHEVSPGLIAGWGRGLALELGDARRGGVSYGCSQRKARLLSIMSPGILDCYYSGTSSIVLLTEAEPD